MFRKMKGGRDIAREIGASHVGLELLLWDREGWFWNKSV